jgi:hypothetical protein
VRIIIQCPENILHLEAEYIYADCPFVNFKPLAVRRRTIHLHQLCFATSLSPIADGHEKGERPPTKWPEDRLP